MSKTVTPLGKHVLIEKVIHGTESGIVLSDTVKDNRMFDIVVRELGPDVKLPIKPGDCLVCADGVHALPTCMEQHYLIHDSDIVGIEKEVAQ